MKKSCELQVKYIPLIKALFSEVNPIPVKKAMNLMGMEVGSLRLSIDRDGRGTCQETGRRNEKSRYYIEIMQDQ